MAWLLIKDGVVVNSIMQPTESWTPPEGHQVVQADGIIGDLWDGVRASKPAPTTDQINVERDRRIEGGFVFRGKQYQSKVTDRENIAGAAQAALLAKLAGTPGDKLDWQVAGTPFVWIALDNSLNPMSPDTVIAFAQAALVAKQAAIFNAFALKASSPIPLNYRDDAFWPVAEGA